MKQFKYTYTHRVNTVSGTFRAESWEDAIDSVIQQVHMDDTIPYSDTHKVIKGIEVEEVVPQSIEKDHSKKEDPCLWAFLFGALVGIFIGVIVTYCFYRFMPG